MNVLVRPRPGRKRRLLALSIALLALALPPAGHAGSRDLAPVAACAGQTDAAAPAPAKIRAMQCLVNWARARRGLPRLRDSRRLDRSSVLRADAIHRCGDFSHTPCGQTFTTVFAQAGYPRGAAIGENIAWGGGPLGSARSAFRSWLGSPPHRRNVFRRGWRDLGVGLVSTDQLFGVPRVSVWVTHFGRR